MATMQLLLCILSLLGAFLTVEAQNSTVALNIQPFVYADSRWTLLGFEIGSDVAAQTYVVHCQPREDCGLIAPLTVTNGPSTLAYTGAIFLQGATDSISCNITGSTTAHCLDFYTTDRDFLYPSDFTVDPTATHLGLSSFTINPSDITSSTDIQLIVTASAAALFTTPAAATTAGSASTASGARPTSVSTGGLPRVTGNAGLALGGAVAAAGLLLGGA